MFVNNIKTETTSTRRAGLIRFTYPIAPPAEINAENHVVVDLTNDLQRSFEGGSITVSSSGRVQLGGTFLQVHDLVHQITEYFAHPHTELWDR